MRFCMSSGVVAEPVLAELFLRLPGAAYVHDAVSPRLVQLSQGWPRLHFSLQMSACDDGPLRVEIYAYFRCLHAPHDKGTRFRLRTTLNCGFGGDCPALEEVVEGGVGGMIATVSPARVMYG
jgi:hypothetical protein